jgi:hypothetical protein
MIKIPMFDPTNMSIGEKLAIVKSKQEEYNELTGYDTPIGYINFVLPGFVLEHSLLTPPISPNLVDKDVVSIFYDTDIMLYINYFGNQEDCLERLDLYNKDYIIREGKISPSWKLVVFFPLHTIEHCFGKEKFNMKYGLQLVGSEINLMNIQKHVEEGINHFNLVFMEIGNEMKPVPANLTLVKELALKFPKVQFLIYSSDADKLNLGPEDRAVVGQSFWKRFV